MVRLKDASEKAKDASFGGRTISYGYAKCLLARGVSGKLLCWALTAAASRREAERTKGATAGISEGVGPAEAKQGACALATRWLQ